MNSNKNDKYNNFYKSKQWITLRNYIRVDKHKGICQYCGKIIRTKTINRYVNGIKKEVEVYQGIVDHIIPIKEDWDKRLDENNLQLLCLECHNSKTFNKETKLKIDKGNVDYEDRDKDVFTIKI